jgi:hypothetical protein
MAQNDIFRLRVHCRLHGGEVINVLHFVDEFGVAVNGSQELANDFRTNMEATLKARASTEFALEYVEVVKLVPYGEGPALSLWPGNTFGTVTGGCPSGSLAEVVTLYTAKVGRRFRGRMYLAGMVTSALSGGSITSTQSTRTQAFVTALMTRYAAVGTAGQFRLGIWSRLIAGPEPPWTTDAFTRVTSATVRTVIRNQRRRQLGVGR